MNKLQAYQESFNLWDWLYKNSGKEKDDYPGYESIKNYLNFCPLCEYFLNRCYECILESCREFTDFGIWLNYYGNWSITEQTKAAKRIRDKIKKELDRLKKT